ncbi:hypothetical protein DEU56DRAFT_835162 [Suillus clintonianus]|uniref:uncharacterized protein n=1 Tax=Suillus clintonianus TaxID=1904413 RepID=UPI001B869016|nr:uncharacterized protein DEU56DRAFT_835162 [Suillus clintonianus]KAG2121106.1 hypothetical protein DEU56DRAFT_835162 [Suillus clintonianus]
MKFTSLIPMIIATAMAGVVVASEDLVINPGNFQCDKNKPVACSRGIKGYNNEYDFGYNCGSNGLVVSWTPCHCHNCCHLINNGKAYSCT